MLLSIRLRPAASSSLLFLFFLPRTSLRLAVCSPWLENPPAGMNEARADGAVLIGGRLDAEGRDAHCAVLKKKKFSPLPLFPRLSEPADVSGGVTFNCCECDSDVRFFFVAGGWEGGAVSRYGP